MITKATVHWYHNPNRRHTYAILHRTSWVGDHSHTLLMNTGTLVYWIPMREARGLIALDYLTEDNFQFLLTSTRNRSDETNLREYIEFCKFYDIDQVERSHKSKLNSLMHNIQRGITYNGSAVIYSTNPEEVVTFHNMPIINEPVRAGFYY